MNEAEPKVHDIRVEAVYSEAKALIMEQVAPTYDLSITRIAEAGQEYPIGHDEDSGIGSGAYTQVPEGCVYVSIYGRGYGLDKFWDGVRQAETLIASARADELTAIRYASSQ